MTENLMKVEWPSWPVSGAKWPLELLTSSWLAASWAPRFSSWVASWQHMVVLEAYGILSASNHGTPPCPQLC